jgi:hypothetical protein
VHDRRSGEPDRLRHRGGRSRRRSNREPRRRAPSSYSACQVTVLYDGGTYSQIETRVVPNDRVGTRVQVLGASIEPIVR